ncbi:CU044_2847 family protein [Oceaniradius stylonematis]|uniref:CU044_2847 family protein n=1 Tax=Oceaniradius stylonematis TaxID=2184161 RepID=UPI00273E77D1|nr:CU044_2847 family protein [Oceaniradius stylonematis]
MSVTYILDNGMKVDLIVSPDGPIVKQYGHERTEKVLSEAIGPAVSMSKQILDQFRTALTPDQLEVEFGLQAGGKGGVWGLTEVSANSSIKIKATWKS